MKEGHRVLEDTGFSGLLFLFLFLKSTSEKIQTLKMWKISREKLAEEVLEAEQ